MTLDLEHKKFMAKAAAKKDQSDEHLPDAAEQEALLASIRSFVGSPGFERIRVSLGLLSLAPPQSLLLEGGSMYDRGKTALYWAALLNCGNINDEDGARRPCLACPVCLRFLSRMHRDLFFFDGAAGSIKIDDVREMRAVLGEVPREALRRVIVLFEGQALGEASANALLKSLEEPKPLSSFVLTAPQRERLLPTLVSRSWVLTLPWPKTDDLSQIPDDELGQASAWGKALLDFTRNGRGWMERVSRRGAPGSQGHMDAKLAMQLVLLCQNALVHALAGNAENATPLASAFASLTPVKLRILNETLAECQDSLIYNVNAALVADWLATRLYFLFAGERQA